MGFDQPWHWIILIAVVVLLFGYKKLPDASRSLGRSLRIFKTEIKGMSEDDRTREAHTETPHAEVVPTATDAAPTAPAASAPAPAAPAAPAEQQHSEQV